MVKAFILKQKSDQMCWVLISSNIIFIQLKANMIQQKNSRYLMYKQECRRNHRDSVRIYEST